MNSFKIIILFFSAIFYLTFVVYLKNFLFFFPFLLLILLILLYLNFKNHNFFITFMLFYGSFSRLFYFLSQGFIYNLVFTIPIFYTLIFFDEIFITFKRLPKILKIYILVHISFILTTTIYAKNFDPVNILLILNYYILPFFLFLYIKDFTKNLYLVLKYTFIFILIYSISQYFGFYTFFEDYYVKNVSYHQYTSLKLGSMNRPFSSFSSVEEFSIFLVFLPFFFYDFKKKMFYLFSIMVVSLLIIFSYRTSIFIFILLYFFQLLLEKRIRQLVIFSLLVLSLIVIFYNLKIDTTIYKTDNRLKTVLKHNIEPLSSGFNTYSLKNRFFKIKGDLYKLKNNPFGTGLFFSSRSIFQHTEENIYETSFFNLLFAGGVITILYFVLSFYLLSVYKKTFFMLIFFFFFLFTNLFNFHFIAPVILKMIMERNDEKG